MYSILKNAKISVSSLKAGDNETLTGATLDMLGFDSVIWIVDALKGESASWSIKAQQDTDSGMGTAADLLGTSVTFAVAVGTDGLTALEVHRPLERYVRALVTVPNITTAAPCSVIAIQFNAKDMPQTNAGEIHVSPIEGTA